LTDVVGSLGSSDEAICPSGQARSGGGVESMRLVDCQGERGSDHGFLAGGDADGELPVTGGLPGYIRDASTY
jgi:hypothetical protein